MNRIVLRTMCTVVPRPAAVVLFLAITLLFHFTCSAGSIEEITELLQFVERSECTFIRNGKEYDSLTEKQHIEKKYRYFKKNIATAEDFIQYSATKSSITGKSYKVFCSGVQMNSSDWLNAELERVRNR